MTKFRAPRGAFSKEIGGVLYLGFEGFKTKEQAGEKAESLRKSGVRARVLPAGKHALEAHGIRWDVWVNPTDYNRVQQR